VDNRADPFRLSLDIDLTSAPPCRTSIYTIDRK